MPGLVRHSRDPRAPAGGPRDRGVTDGSDAVALGPGSGRNTLHGRAWPHPPDDDERREAIPGVQTPLGWSVWEDAGEEALRRSFHKIGALDRSEIAVPRRPEDRLFSLFYGRIAVHLDLLCEWTDRVPGTSGEAMAKQLFTYVPPAYTSRPQRRYYPRVIARAAIPWVHAPRLMRASRRRLAALWERSVRTAHALDDEGAPAAARGGGRVQDGDLPPHAPDDGCGPAGVRPPREGLPRQRDLRPGADGRARGHEETAMLHDLWKCSRDRMTLERFLEGHGFHGPREGDSSVMWREDPEPVLRLIEGYRLKPDDADPVSLERAQIARRREESNRNFSRGCRDGAGRSRASRSPSGSGTSRCAGSERSRTCRASTSPEPARAASASSRPRPGARRRRGRFLPHRRRSAGRLAVRLRRAGRRTSPLLRALRLARPAGGLAGRAGSGRDGAGHGRRHRGHRRQSGDRRGACQGHSRSGRGGGRGGRDPHRPQHGSGMGLVDVPVSGLVSDIGGLMSHTAVVARELGIPCVVNTGTATKALSTGDRIRLNGTTGTVEVVEAAARF